MVGAVSIMEAAMPKSPSSAPAVVALACVLLALAMTGTVAKAGISHSDFIVVKLFDKASSK